MDYATPFMTATQPDRSFRNSLIFWITLALLNFLLFLPLYLLNLENTYFAPWISATGELPSKLGQWLFKWRANFDIFRICLDVVIIAALAALIPVEQNGNGRLVGLIGRAFFRAVLGVGYLLILYYYIYEAVTLSFFLVDPIFYNQYFMAIDGLQFLLQHINLTWITYVLAIVGLLLLHGLVIWLLRLLFVAAPRINWGSRTLLFGLLIVVGLVGMRYREATANPLMVVNSAAYKIKKNIDDSFEVQANTAAYDEAAVLATYDYTDASRFGGSLANVPLSRRPNVYVILVESYGSVLYKRDDFREAYTTLLGELDQTLAAEEWHVASTMSTAPTWGGGSWMSYASLLFGLHIDKHPQFLFLRNQYRFKDYPDLGHFLKAQGYRYFRLSSMSVEMPDYEWAQYQSFYGVDDWLRYRDLAYTGTRYSWGPSPPDQYSLNFMRDHMRAETANGEDPTLFFFITQNSHYPWTPMPPVVDAWQALNQPMDTVAAAGTRDHQWMRRNYLNSIEYQLRTLTDFVLAGEDEDAIYILVGDHQPPRVSRKSDGWETPMHIISRDPALTESLAQYGFTQGLAVDCLPDACEAGIKHEGFYSLFVRTLLGRYAEEMVVLPPYVPDGVTFGGTQIEAALQDDEVLSN